MKKVLSIMMVALMAAMSVSFIACSKDDDNGIADTATVPELITVNVMTGGTLSALMDNVDKSNVKSLKITGVLNGTDIAFIREIADAENTILENLDIEECRIIEGGDAYYNDYTTSNDVIGEYMFYSLEKLKIIKVPADATSIGSNAFWDCSGLTSITIPNSVTSIDRIAFRNCYSLSTIVVESGNSIYDSRDNCNAIIETSSNTLITGCKSTIIPENITSIGERAFSDCSDLTSITIPNSVTSIGERAFYDCSGLISITISENVTTIGKYAFVRCGLTSVTIPNSVTSIGGGAFADCSGLTSITMSNRIIKIERYAFQKCFQLNAIKILAVTPPELDIRVFYRISPDCILYVPQGSLENYKDWSQYFKEIKEL